MTDLYNVFMVVAQRQKVGCQSCKEWRRRGHVLLSGTKFQFWIKEKWI